MQSVEERIAQIVHGVSKAPLEQLKPDVDLRVELNIDSLMALRIIARVEKEFGIEVPTDELGSHSTIAEIAALIREEIGSDEQ